ncbi:FKBP-type peptidyl-prolyl cis-trans isomerase [Chitinophaga rhizosphaerae]|uniref:FKBP-type peptidyl-prolyl cis-trans isomerase n=1 Tax=Chitinophaga rhizosphaerae TaxID=1864947 RepID=UPI0013E03079|nr:FKBP-type peptidyl-prolyl cis-trans isomerase [Chitinophaga rhizosphaerae]
MLLIKGFRFRYVLAALCLVALAGAMAGCAKESLEGQARFADDVSRDMETVRTWLIQHKKDSGTVLHPSGIIYKIMDEGDHSDTIGLEEIPVVTFTRRLFPTEQIVEAAPLPTSFDNRKLKDHIPGWRIGLPLISKGGRILMYIPARLAFANIGIPGIIPPNSILICDVTLIDIRK